MDQHVVGDVKCEVEGTNISSSLKGGQGQRSPQRGVREGLV